MGDRKKQCLVLLLVASIYLLWFEGGGRGIDNLRKMSPRVSPIKVPVIMAWNGFFKGNLTRTIAYRVNGCPNACQVISHSLSPEVLRRSDAIVFHSRDSFEVPPLRLPHQLYVFFTMESPVNVGEMIGKVPPDFFNVSMTYHPTSSVNYANQYATIKRLESYNPEQMKQKIDNAMAKKKFGSLAFVSHCRTDSRREDYSAELRKHTEVTLQGECYNSTTSCPRSNPTCEMDLIESHMFYLAFENSVCQDYVTEKFFRARHFIVPVVLKRSVLKNIVPDHMFIAADDYDSPQQLADYLNYLRKDRAAYRNYFSYANYEEIISKSFGFCDLCKDLNTLPPKRSIIKDIKRHYSTKECEPSFAHKLLKSRS